MVSQKYRWDFIGLSTDEKPTSETSDKVVNGSTYYCSDTSKLYVYCDGTWYERKPLGGGGGGGTSDFNDLSNRPKYNGSDMTGSTNIPEVKTYTAGSNVAISDQNVISATDTTYSNFTGTDGTAAGTAGLVPAPTTTDAGKFLKADGTWDSAGGGSGGITELTSADYDYPDDSPDGVALWRLDGGLYYVSDGTTKLYTNNITSSTPVAQTTLLLIRNPASNAQAISIIRQTNGTDVPHAYVTNINNGNGIVLNKSLGGPTVNDTLTSTSTSQALSANQGKVLNEKIGDLTNLTTTDKSNLVAAINEAATGGGGVTELTTADYNYPTNNPDGVALWLLEPGLYSAKNNTLIYETTSDSFSSGGTWIVANEDRDTYGVIAMCYGVDSLYYYRISSYSGTLLSKVKLLDIEQSTGTSTTSVMSQNAVTSMVFADPSIREAVRIGNTKTVNAGSVGIGRITGSQYTGASGNYSIAIGSDASAGTNGAVSIGREADVRGIARGAIALGAYSKATSAGEMNIGSSDTSYGYNNSNYRLLTGLYDPQNAHDATNKEYVDPTTDSSAPTTATVGRLGQIQIDTTTATAYMCVAVDTVTPAYTWKQITA